LADLLSVSAGKKRRKHRDGTCVFMSADRVRLLTDVLLRIHLLSVGIRGKIEAPMGLLGTIEDKS